MTFKRILIANRGEIAVRIIRACRELGISPAVVYSEADAGALHVRLADVAMQIGPPAAAQSYLRGEKLIAAAQALGAEAIHPGYGFLSENAAFARMCREAGIVFIGPPAEAIEAMGGKIGARRIAVEAGVPVAPGYDGADQSEATLAAEAERIGFPLLVKASAGGGGKGMRVVNSLAEFPAALEGARREAGAAFGDATVFLERLILRPRHVEIQILADSHGNVVHLGERECSIQRRHQKILEESPSPALSPELRSAMGAAAVRAARAAGYVNAGTVEFVLDPEGNYYFLEMNTRLQVEHPVTELVTGLDLVRLQIAVAAGEPLPFTQEQVTFRGHAIEVRLYAEDPVTFLPAIGKLALLDPPLGPGVRVDSGLTSGDEVTVHYDPMIAKLIVSGADRHAAIDRLRRALDDYAVLGLTTNLPLLRAIAANPAFVEGATHTGFLGEQQIHAAPPKTLPNHVLAAAAVWALQAETQVAPRSPFENRWRADGIETPLTLTFGHEEHALRVKRAGTTWHIHAAEAKLTTQVASLRADELILSFENAERERFRITRDAAGDLLIGWRGDAYRLTRPAPLSADSVGRAGHGHDGASLTAPMPGTLVKVLVSEGETVAEGQPLLVLEAMKMEHTVVAPYAGIVRRIPFKAGSSVTGGADLIEVEAQES
ncbi:carbamoyl-phosphate synthase L chain ATP-binding [Oscillochloris trichoides DG-6]|uniref:Biotin-dependent 3-methylcrotonyl-coenzyme A carboxylase alpha1 subunit n=1 Tax=Oscillochloris trichoides DG-6 TaxID=765420 RepID=E1IE52_9CHLR|nr:acetyl-CoA carboxylase biotin carboxylase subunit [Oscillochloris trichoides]EFO80512.1 carbamoyl-phosphate synthase L chain ATP-binding [Oscillochloris trichoides DG-6]